MAALAVEVKPNLVAQASGADDKLLPDGSMDAVDRGRVAILRTGIKLLLCTIFLGTLVLWIIFPTSTYDELNIRVSEAITGFRFLGEQGTSILVWTMPMLSVSVLGCLYLHLGELGRNGKKDFALTLKRPVLVRGPLGIVSRVVLAFFLVFASILVWSFYTYSVLSEEKTWQTKLMKGALKSGHLANICLAFLFFPVARGSSVLRLLGLTSAASIKYHMWLGHLVMILSTTHGIGHMIYWTLTDQASKIKEWPKLGVSNVAGEITLAAGLIMWATTFRCIRRRMFEVFFYTHYLYIAFVVFYVLHVGISFAFMMIPGFYLFMIDRYLRFLQSRRTIRLLSARVFPCGTLELNFVKSLGWDYSPMSVMFINIPSISKLQWHPFTIISSSKLDPERISIMLKSEGSWTSKLYQKLLSPSTVDHLGVTIERPTKLHRILSSPSKVDHLNVFIEGPYGPTNTDFLRHDILVMVSGGSGITPFISIIRELTFLSTTPQLKLPQIVLICAFRKSADIALLNLIQPPAHAPVEVSNLQLQIKAYVTRDGKPPATNYLKRIRTIWLRPQQTDLPISPILGPNSWLWLGAIVSSSFIIYLILMGIVTECCINSVDQNNKIHSYSIRAAFNIVLLCVSVVATTSGAALWNKRKIGKQVQNMEDVTRVGTPQSRFYDADKESARGGPHGFHSGATEVRYRERPDVKKILLEHIIKGTSVGVMACGPKQLRQEAARICSSGLADNLHFESISFSW